MRNKIVVTLVVLVNLLLLSSCDEIGDIISRGAENISEARLIVSEVQRADDRTEQIISAIKNKDKDAIKSLFSAKALSETDDFDSDLDYLFEFMQGEIDSWDRDGWSSDESSEYGRRTLMVRFAINVYTNENDYRFFIIDYNVDTINPDNQGVYMLEVRLTDSPNTGSWQDRMRAGIYIH